MVENKCEHEYIRMQYAEEEFKCAKCGETMPHTQDNTEILNLIDFKRRLKKSLNNK